MRAIGFLLILALLSGCASNGILLKQGQRFFIYEENNKRPVMSFTIPEGTWSISKVTLQTTKKGWFDIVGRPPNSIFGYSVRFKITPAERHGNNVIDILKSDDFIAYLNRVDTAVSPKALAEMGAEHYGKKLIKLNEYSCKNDWYQQRLAPQTNNGKGIPWFRNFIECPLVIDGRVFIFSINVNSSMRPDFIKHQTELNKDKKSEEQVAVDTDANLSTLGDKVLVMFNDIQFQDKVSQDYGDIRSDR